MLINYECFFSSGMKYLSEPIIRSPQVISSKVGSCSFSLAELANMSAVRTNVNFEIFHKSLLDFFKNDFDIFTFPGAKHDSHY